MPEHDSDHDDETQGPSRTELAFDDLATFFDDSSDATGLSGINYGAGTGGVFDADASVRAHMRRRAPSVRAAVQRRSQTLATLMTLPFHDQVVLSLAFTPRRWEWTDLRPLARRKDPSAYESATRKAFRMTDQPGDRIPARNLLALGLESASAWAAYVESHGAEPPSKLEILAHIEELALKDDEPSRKVIDIVKREVTALLMQSVDAYIEAVRARDDALGDIRREEAARARARARLAVLRGGADA